jgi:hypothetical protein
MRIRVAAGLFVVALILSLTVVVHSQQSASAPRANPQGNGHFTFGLIGDMPYGPEGDVTESFKLAAARNHKAVMIIIQANPNFDLAPANPARSGFNDFLAAREGNDRLRTACRPGARRFALFSIG